MAGRDLYILDFSYKRPVMLDLIRKARAVVCLDHHKTAAEELAGDLSVIVGEGLSMSLRCPTIIFDMNKSGARLAWEFFFPHRCVPLIVRMVEDRDLWRWALPNSREMNAALASLPRTFEEWDRLDGLVNPEELVLQGAAILRYQQQLVDAHCQHAVEIEMDGHKILAVNATCLMSEIGGQLAENRPFGVTWYRRGDQRYQVSLRSSSTGVDVSEVARKYGGGGHKHAAGFATDSPPFQV